MLKSSPFAFASTWSRRTNVRILIIRRGELIHAARLHNVITVGGHNLMRDQIRGVDDARIRFVAVGAGDTAPDASDTGLEDERLRVPVLRFDTGSTGEIITTASVLDNQGNDFVTEEIGWYAGPATDEPGSGILIARALFSWPKNALESIQIERADTFVEASP